MKLRNRYLFGLLMLQIVLITMMLLLHDELGFSALVTNILIVLNLVNCVIIYIGLKRALEVNNQHMQDEFLAFQDAANIGAWVWNINDKTISFSSTAQKILRLTIEQQSIPAREFPLLIHEADRNGHLEKVKDSLSTGEAFEMTFRTGASDAEQWIEARGELTFDEHDKPYEMIGMFKDVTRSVLQKHIQERMKSILEIIITHETFEVIMQQLCNTIAEIRPKIYPVIILKDLRDLTNQAYFSNHTPAALREHVHSLKGATTENELDRVLEARSRLHVKNIDQSPGWRKEPALLDIEVNEFYGQKLLSNKDQVKGLIAFYLLPDEHEYELHEELLDLASKVTEVAIDSQLQTVSTRQIQQQLYHTQKMESIGHLTGGIAHDFNNILGSIIGYNSLAKKVAAKTDDRKLQSFLSEVQVAAERARDLISQMLVFSRSEPTTNVPVDAKPVIKEVISLVRSMIPSSININYSFDQSIDKISMNPVSLHQVIMNFIINSKDAIEKVGEINISLSMQNLPETSCVSCHQPFSGKYVCIEVKDTGHGVKSELISKMFDPFFTTKDIGRGTGMGLSVVHGIIHDANGHISVESETGVGTSIRVYIPSAAVQILKQEQLSKEDTTGTFGNGQHILVVDDDVPLSLLFKEILSSYGYKVSRFDNSQLALDFYLQETNEIDLVLTDQTMPVMTGDELAKKMLEVRPEQKIIICTGFSETLNEESAKSLGVDALLDKPVDMYKLLEQIRATIDNDKSVQ